MGTNSYGDINVSSNAEYMYNDELIKPKSPEHIQVKIEKEEDKFNLRLIHIVKKYPIIYDRSYTAKFPLLKQRNSTWKSIAKELKTDVETCKVRWSRLRVSLRCLLDLHKIKICQNKRPANTDPPWKFYDAMKFMLPHSKSRRKPTYCSRLCTGFCYDYDEDACSTSSYPVERNLNAEVLETIEIDDDDDEESRASNATEETHTQETETNELDIEIKDVRFAVQNENVKESNVQKQCGNIKIENDNSDTKHNSSITINSEERDVKLVLNTCEKQDVNIESDANGGQTNETDCGQVKFKKESDNEHETGTSDDKLEMEYDTNQIAIKTDSQEEIKPAYEINDTVESDCDNDLQIDTNSPKTIKTDEIDEGKIDYDDSYQEALEAIKMISDNKDESNQYAQTPEDTCNKLFNDTIMLDDNGEPIDEPVNDDDDDCIETTDDTKKERFNAKDKINMEKDMKLIEMVKQYPIIYKQRWVYNPEERRRTWNIIATETGLTSEECKSRWDHLKKRFVYALKYPLAERSKRKEYNCIKTAKLKRQWLITHMQFFFPYIKARTRKNIPINKIVKENAMEVATQGERLEGRQSDDVMAVESNEVVGDDQSGDVKAVQSEESSWSDDEAEDFVLKSYITNVLYDKDKRQKNIHAVDVEEELSCYTNFFS